MDYPELKRTVIQQRSFWRATSTLIEDKASGIQLIQELKGEGVSGVTGVVPEGDNYCRMNTLTAQMENGFVRLPKQAPWLEACIHELTSFPASKYKDQVDSTSQALAWLVMKGQMPGIIGYFYEMAAEKYNCSIEEIQERILQKRL